MEFQVIMEEDFQVKMPRVSEQQSVPRESPMVEKLSMAAAGSHKWEAVTVRSSKWHVLGRQ